MPHIDDGTLHALLDGALRAEEPERADAVEAHLDACADCRARLEHAAALRDEASDVLAALDYGLSDDAEAPTPAPDFGEVLARAEAAEGEAVDEVADPAASGATGTGDPAPRSPADVARLRRRLGWTRGLAWAATIVVALGTGYIVRGMAGPTGELPRAATPTESAVPAAAPMSAPAEGADRVPGGATEDEVAPRPEANTGPEGSPEPAAPEPAAPEPAAAEEAPAPAPTRQSPAVAGAGGVTATPSETDAEAAKTLTIQTAAPDSALSAARRRADDARTEMMQSLRGQGIQPTAVAAPEPQPSARAEVQRTSLSVDGVAADVAEATRLVGCYRLELGEWSPPRGQGEGQYQTPPAVFELTDSIGPPAGTVEDRGLAAYHEQGRLLLRPLITPDDDAMGGHPLAYWMPVSPDSVRLVWSNGFIGVRVDLAVRGNIALEGQAVGSSDAVVEGHPNPTAAARAVRVNCPPDGG